MTVADSSRRQVARLFDLVGEEFDRRPDYYATHLEQMGRLIDAGCAAAELAGRRILDAGCGTGVATAHFARRGAALAVGLDISGGSLTTAQAGARRLGLAATRFVRGDLMQLPFKAGAFDLVFTCGADVYAPRPEQAQDEMLRAVRPGGTALLCLFRFRPINHVFSAISAVLSRLPFGAINALAGLLAFILYPVSGLFLHRDVKLQSGKPLKQTIIEGLFSPVRLRGVTDAEARSRLAAHGFGAITPVTGITGVDFYTPQSILVLKAAKQ